MSDVRKGNVRWKGHEYGVTWHPISKEGYVYLGGLEIHRQGLRHAAGP